MRQEVQAPDDGRAGGLDAFVEAGKVGEFAAVVGDGAHEPVLFWEEEGVSGVKWSGVEGLFVYFY